MNGYGSRPWATQGTHPSVGLGTTETNPAQGWEQGTAYAHHGAMGAPSSNFQRSAGSRSTQGNWQPSYEHGHHHHHGVQTHDAFQHDAGHDAGHWQRTATPDTNAPVLKRAGTEDSWWGGDDFDEEGEGEEHHQRSALKDLAEHVHLRRCLWCSVIGCLLYGVGGCTEIGLWIKMVPEKGDAHGPGMSKSFPYSTISFGPTRFDGLLQQSVTPSLWAAEVCGLDLEGLKDWMGFLTGHLDRSDASKEECHDRGGPWCNKWDGREPDNFNELCRHGKNASDTGVNGTNGRILAGLCAETCRHCVPHHNRATQNDVWKRAKNPWCRFRKVIANSFDRASMAVTILVFTLPPTVLVILNYRHFPIPVFICFFLQLTSFLWFAVNFIPLIMNPHAAPSSTRDELAKFFDEYMKDGPDPNIGHVFQLYEEFMERPTEMTPEANITCIAMLVHLYGIFQMFQWWVSLQGCPMYTFLVAFVTKAVSCIFEVTVNIPIRCLHHLLLGDGSAPSKYGDRVGHPGRRWYHLGTLCKEWHGHPLPFPVDWMVHSSFTLYGHFWRLNEWDGFVEPNCICSNAEETALHDHGVTDRTVKNILAWRRSVMYMALLFGLFVVPFRLLEVSRSMHKHSKRAESLKWPEEWSEFEEAWYLSQASWDEEFQYHRQARAQDYIVSMGSKLLALIETVDSPADQWISLISLGSEFMSVVLVCLSLLSWMWWSSSRRYMVVAALSLVYAPVVVSLLPKGIFIREQAFDDLDLFIERIGQNLVHKMSVDQGVLTCWQTIDKSMDQVYWLRRKSHELCAKVGNIWPNRDKPAYLLPFNKVEVTAARDKCMEYVDKASMIDLRIAEAEELVRGACVGFQQAFFHGDADPASFPLEGQLPRYNTTIVNLIMMGKNSSEKGMNFIADDAKFVLRLYAGTRSAVGTMLTLYPVMITVAPSVLIAAWRVRLLMPLSRLPSIIILSLPWIVSPLLWMQVLWFWQLMSSPLLACAILCLCMSIMHWVITSHIFGTTDPMPGPQLMYALRKQGLVDWFFLLSAAVLVGIWLVDYEPGETGDSVRQKIVFFAWARAEPRTFIRLIFQFLVTRCMAMDFILSMITAEHLFDRSIESMRKVADKFNKAKKDKTKHKDTKKVEVTAPDQLEMSNLEVHLERVTENEDNQEPSEQPSSRPKQARFADDPEESSGSSSSDEADERDMSESTRKMYWERVAILDVLEMADQRAATLDALVDVNHRLRLEGEEQLKPVGEELEMSDLNGVTANTKDKPSGEEPEAADKAKTFARRASRWGLMPARSQTANFTHLLGEFRPEYAPPPPVRHWAPPPHTYAPPTYPQQWGGYQGHAHPAHVAHPAPNQGYSGYGANPGYGSHIPQASHHQIPLGSSGQGAQQGPPQGGPHAVGHPHHHHQQHQQHPIAHGMSSHGPGSVPRPHYGHYGAPHAGSQGHHHPHGGQYGNPYGSQQSQHGPPNASGKGFGSRQGTGPVWH